MDILQLEDGKADIEMSADELVALLPPPYLYRRYNNTRTNLNNRVVVVAANVTERVTGTVLSGNSTVRCTSQKYRLSFLEITPTSFKPGLTVSAYVRISVIRLFFCLLITVSA